MSAIAANNTANSTANSTATKKPHITNNSGKDDWMTPAWILEVARKVMGGIDLDPASSHHANRYHVYAKTYYDKHIDGLSQPWRGKVWLNPPYARGIINQFVDKLILHWQAGDITQAVVITNNATETTWGQALAEHCTAFCLLRGRVKYLKPNGESANSPLQGQVLWYFGGNPNLGTFHTACLPYGIVMAKRAIYQPIPVDKCCQ